MPERDDPSVVSVNYTSSAHRLAPDRRCGGDVVGVEARRPHVEARHLPAVDLLDHHRRHGARRERAALPEAASAGAGVPINPGTLRCRPPTSSDAVR